MDLPVYRIEDKFVKNICSGKFYVYFVSAEDQTVKDSLYLHYSPILTSKGEAKVISDKIHKFLKVFVSLNHSMIR